MNYDVWKSKVLNGPPLDVDNSGDDDCVDVSKDWAQYLFPGVSWVNSIGYGNAKDIYANASTTYFDKIPYTKGFIPQQGDIGVFDATPAPGYTNTFNNPYGHTGVIDSANTTSYAMVQQESGTGTPPRLATWLWSYRPPIGFLRPKLQGVTTMAAQADPQRALYAARIVSEFVLGRVGAVNDGSSDGDIKQYHLQAYEDSPESVEDIVNSFESGEGTTARNNLFYARLALQALNEAADSYQLPHVNGVDSVKAIMQKFNSDDALLERMVEAMEKLANKE